VVALAACATHGAAPAAEPAAASASDSMQIGYGAQPRDKSTGATTTLSGAELTTRRPMRVEDLLRGRVAGLEIIQEGNAVKFRIRGAPALQPGQEVEPLVIVDDMMIQSGNIANALSGLIPEDIKQVTVLKDVASTSVYGGRGAGGVILITTRSRQKPTE
jgi:TonB-dependent SusC/RagA subfamily outer membrane receptor